VDIRSRAISILRVLAPGLFQKRKPLQFSIITMLVMVSITSAFIAANIENSGARSTLHESKYTRTIRLIGWGWPLPSYMEEITTRNVITPEKADEELRSVCYRDRFASGWIISAIGWVPIYVARGLFLNGSILLSILILTGWLSEGSLSLLARTRRPPLSR